MNKIIRSIMNKIIDAKRVQYVSYHVAEGAESDDIGFSSSSGIPEFRTGITISSISGKTNFF